jgi:hypothetical protein
MSIKEAETHTYGSIAELLFDIATQADEMEADAELQLYARRDSIQFKRIIKQRAELLKGLPDTVENFRLGGGSVPAEVEFVAFKIGSMANRCIEYNTLPGMRMLLVTAERAEGPNDLALLAEKYSVE